MTFSTHRFQRTAVQTSTLAGIALAVALGLPAQAAGTDGSKGYCERSLQGSYSLFLNGTITTLGIPVPTWAVGIGTLDGRGTMFIQESTFNIGGCLVLKLAGQGTYGVDPNGTGTATVTVDLAEPPLSNPLCSIPDELAALPVVFDFAFAINSETLDIVGTTWKNAQGEFAAGFGSSGQARRQDGKPISPGGCFHNRAARVPAE